MFHREIDTLNCRQALSECDRDFESPREVLAGQDRWVAKRLTVIQVAVYAIARHTGMIQILQLCTAFVRDGCQQSLGPIVSTSRYAGVRARPEHTAQDLGGIAMTLS